jgi:membrane protein
MTDAKRRLRRVLARVPGALPFVRLTVATIRVCLRYRVTGLASEAGFFALLSLPPLVLGLFGGLGYLKGWLGQEAVDDVRQAILDYAGRFLTPQVIDSVLGPTVDDVLRTGRADLLSIGFVLSLWSGSRALNVFVDTISIMYGQSGVRGIVQTRALSFSLYLVALVMGIITIPLVLLGPTVLRDLLPAPWDGLIVLYWPLVTLLTVGGLTSLYHVSTPRRSPWTRDVPGAVLTLVIWALASFVVRGTIAASLGGSSIYGPLSAPIVLLIWLYALAIAVLIGAALNAAIRQMWPHHERRALHERLIDRLRERRLRRREEAWPDPFEGYAMLDEDTLGLRSLRDAANQPLTPMAGANASAGAADGKRARAAADVDR